MALFGSKKDDAPKPAAAGAGAPPGSVPPPAAAEGGGFNSDKAGKFFQHARAVHETGNYEYAMQLWLSGMRWDPNSVNGLEGFYNAVAAFLSDPATKKVASKELLRTVGGKGDVDRYLGAQLEWGLRPTDGLLAVRAFESAAKLKLHEPGVWIGERAMGAVMKEKKIRKESLLKIAAAFSTLGAYDKAVIAAEQGLKVDPTDGELAAFVRSLAAQHTMNKGGYDQTGQAGGFRQNIRDAQKQQHLDESERIVKTDETIERLLTAAENELIKRPGDVPSMEKYAKLLLERGRPEDEEKAHAIYTQAYEASKAFRWRELSGTIRTRQARRKAMDLRKMLEQSAGNEMLTRMIEQAAKEAVELEAAEYRLQVEAYPTDLSRKFELGKRTFQLGNYHEAIELFQEAQHDPRNRAAALSLLGQSFLKIQWNDEGIDALRRALDMKDIAPEVNLELRYWLMTALQAKAESDRDLDAANEADKLAASIAVQQIGYMDIRARREAVKKVVSELRAARG